MQSKTERRDFTHSDVIKWTFLLVAVAAIALCVLFALYFYNFRALGLSASSTEWGRFGDFVGGTANPILAFMTLIGLLLTMLLQGRQIETAKLELQQSQSELVLTREQLARAATASEQSAKYGSVNMLLAHYREEIGRLSAQNLVPSDPRNDKLKELRSRENSLNEQLDRLFFEISKSH